MNEVFSNNRVYRTLAPDRVESGVGSLDQLSRILTRLKVGRIIVACSRSIAHNTPLLNQVREHLGNMPVQIFDECRQHSPEADIDALAKLISEINSDAVISIGGSSVFDTVKIAISRSADTAHREPIPQIAIPTTLSAGEFTPGAGYTEAKTGSKQLVLDTRVSPHCVILDPSVTVYTPDELWLSTGMKALDHAMEAVWSIKPHPYVDALALEAIRLLFKNLPLAKSAENLEARAACQMGAWMSIAGVGAAGMRLSHFLGHQIGARMHIPHGITSCILLPAVMRHLRNDTLDAQCRIAAAMGVEAESKSATGRADEAVDRLEQLISELGLPGSISEAGGSMDDIDIVAELSIDAATTLGLTHDLPDGANSVRSILLSAY